MAQHNGSAVYGDMKKAGRRIGGGNGVTGSSISGNSVFLWNWIWPSGGAMALGGYMSVPKAVRFVHDGTPVDFEHKGRRIILKNFPRPAPLRLAGILFCQLLSAVKQGTGGHGR